ncbi:MAG TPA: YibE/F family protein [Anaerovoracaceae bacterium]|nr:YibE/F family protein [Anaerovoracaceae bacterium]
MEKRNKQLDLIIITLITISTFLFIILGNKAFDYSAANESDEDFIKATVITIVDENVSNEHDLTNTTVTFKCMLDTGENEGEIINAEQYLTGEVLGSTAKVEKNDKILVTYTENSKDGNMTWQYVGPNRTKGIIILVLVFFALILLIGKAKGFGTIITLILTLGILFGVYIPAILSGINIYKATIIVSAIIIFTTVIILNGLTKKTLCAIVGNLGGILVAGILAYVFNSFLQITGLVDEDSILLTMLESDVSIDLKGLVWAGVVIGALGAIMDVAVSLASSMKELAYEMNDKSPIKMIKSGLNIGRDAISTMTNTLILAYVGGSFSIILLFFAYNKDLFYLLNLELIVTEIIQGVVGSIGILMAVPITVLFSAWIFNNEND